MIMTLVAAQETKNNLYKSILTKCIKWDFSLSRLRADFLITFYYFIVLLPFFSYDITLFLLHYFLIMLLCIELICRVR